METRELYIYICKNCKKKRNTVKRWRAEDELCTPCRKALDVDPRQVRLFHEFDCESQPEGMPCICDHLADERFNEDTKVYS